MLLSLLVDVLGVGSENPLMMEQEGFVLDFPLSKVCLDYQPPVEKHFLPSLELRCVRGRELWVE